MVDGPCKGCTERYYTCHATCEKYYSWKSELSVIKENRRKYYQNLSACSSAALKKFRYKRGEY